MPAEHFNSGGWWWGYGYGHYHYYHYGINNRYQGGVVVVASQRLGRYQYPDGSRYENWLTYSESRPQFELGPTNDKHKAGLHSQLKFELSEHFFHQQKQPARVILIIKSTLSEHLCCKCA